MKLTRILAMPFTLAADIATLGNMGDRSFTQQLFDADKRERQHKEIIEAANAVAKIIKAQRGGGE